MKNIILLLVLIVIINSFVEAHKKTFMRFYDAFGHKFEKGYFVGTTNSSVIVYKELGKLEIPISKIFTIKTKRSLGHHILLSAVIEAVPLSIYWVSKGEPKQNDSTPGGAIHDYFTSTSGEGAIAGIFTGGLTGTITGVLINKFRRNDIFRIEGNNEN